MLNIDIDDTNEPAKCIIRGLFMLFTPVKVSPGNLLEDQNTYNIDSVVMIFFKKSCRAINQLFVYGLRISEKYIILPSR